MFKKLKRILPSVAFLLTVFILAGALIICPKESYSENEKRLLADTPEVSFEAVAKGKFTEELEVYVSDHFPLRDAFVGINAYFNLLCGRNYASDVYYCKDNYLISAPGKVSGEQTEANVKKFNEFAKDNKLKATLMLVPTSGYIMEDVLPEKHKAYNDDVVFDSAKKVKGDMEYIDLRQSFRDNKDEIQLYYKTDHHVTTAGAYKMYENFLDTKNIKPTAQYDVVTKSGFYGTAYSKSGYWLTPDDTVEMWKNKNLQPTVEIIEPGKDTIKSDSLFFENRLDEADKYTVFLDGNHTLVKITNPSAKGGKILVVKDSFAHIFTCFLAEQYSEIYMVDMRYYRKPLSNLVKENKIPEVLYLYGAENLGSDTNSAWIM